MRFIVALTFVTTNFVVTEPSFCQHLKKAHYCRMKLKMRQLINMLAYNDLTPIKNMAPVRWNSLLFIPPYQQHNNQDKAVVIFHAISTFA